MENHMEVGPKIHEQNVQSATTGEVKEQKSKMYAELPLKERIWNSVDSAIQTRSAEKTMKKEGKMEVKSEKDTNLKGQMSRIKDCCKFIASENVNLLFAGNLKNAKSRYDENQLGPKSEKINAQLSSIKDQIKTLKEDLNINKKNLTESSPQDKPFWEKLIAKQSTKLETLTKKQGELGTSLAGINSKIDTKKDRSNARLMEINESIKSDKLSASAIKFKDQLELFDKQESLEQDIEVRTEQKNNLEKLQNESKKELEEELAKTPENQDKNKVEELQTSIRGFATLIKSEESTITDLNKQIKNLNQEPIATKSEADINKAKAGKIEFLKGDIKISEGFLANDKMRLGELAQKKTDMRLMEDIDDLVTKKNQNPLSLSPDEKKTLRKWDLLSFEHKEAFNAVKDAEKEIKILQNELETLEKS